MRSSGSREDIQMTSAAVCATALYLASVDDLVTVRCLREHHETTFDPRTTTYALVEVQSSLFPA